MAALDPSEEAASSARQTWLRHIGDQRTFDRELAAILRDAAKNAEQQLLTILGDNVSATMRRAQLQVSIARLNMLADEMWGAITPAMTKATEQAAQLGIDGLMAIDSILMEAVGDTGLRSSILEAAQHAADNVRSRLLNDIQLSDKVYKTKALTNKWVEQVVNRGIATNMSAKEIARAVRHLIDPNVKGGVSYAASRLARTELNNAFHTSTIRSAADQPWVTGFKWNLSDSHPRPDPCNEFADDDSEGLGAGIFSPKNAPGKPHPMCLCYLTVITIDDEELINNLANGKYDKFIHGDDSMVRGVSRTPHDAMSDYHTNSFDMNSKLRRGIETDDVQLIDGIMSQAVTGKSHTAYRVVDSADFRRLVRSTGGKSFADKAFVSTTTDKSMLEDFFQGSTRERVLMKISVPKGSHAVKVSDYVGDDPFFFDQGELLLDRDAVFQIVNQRVTDDGLMVDVTLISSRQARRQL